MNESLKRALRRLKPYELNEVRDLCGVMYEEKISASKEFTRLFNSLLDAAADWLGCPLEWERGTKEQTMARTAIAYILRGKGYKVGEIAKHMEKDRACIYYYLERADNARKDPNADRDLAEAIYEIYKRI